MFHNVDNIQIYRLLYCLLVVRSHLGYAGIIWNRKRGHTADVIENV